MAGEEPVYWERMLKAAPYHGTIEKLQDAVDVPGWRQIEATRALALEAAETPPRRIGERAGTVRGRSFRQVNVKLAAVDFEMLCALAVASDVAPSTLARMLLREALKREAGSRAD
jgi:hypothetical protein